jgi:hypothetical protein
MAYLVGAFVGAGIAALLFTSLFMWLFGLKMGDTRARILWAFGSAYLAMFVLSGLGNADGGAFNPWKNWVLYTFWFVVVLIVQMMAFGGREARRQRERRPIRFD